ncbi:D-alanyl-D-alanine carboxypeptidase family protein [Consotaella salsifontis]|uniref:serine-type D-Ala-D-Ala carboxypeptidase n=1 Tax=Consotaella salsifontis TaxID=1365950 RepID=A0A1T4LXD1_9HYPH|nr:D-alanyl-D-alanine carboxypeptidase family protein [Consotaella salsifontis]SJZ59325.1 D-alanyl-D-alanine carboxypeptidase (penicillin-binding protein 5/6) [Consotaella salsifontis]
MLRSFLVHPFRLFLCSLLMAALLAVVPGSAQESSAPTIETTAKQAILIDGESGAVLFEKSADEPFEPASLAKLMTMDLVFDALAKGKIALDQTFAVTEHAWRTGGAPSGAATMFAKLNSEVPVEALIRGAIVQGANDAAIALAEGMAGTEGAFAMLMNQRAEELGLKHSRFVNPTGLPADGQQVSARDMAVLARHIERSYPDLYKIYAEPSYEWNKIFQRNRNPLLEMDIGADGMGTGYTESSGYSLVGVTHGEDRTTILVVSGLASAKERASEARRLLEWARDSFRRQTLFAASDVVGTAEVYGGTQSSVALTPSQDLVALVPEQAPDSVTAHIKYVGPLKAPVEQGTKVANIEIRIGERLSLTAPLYTAESIAVGSFSGRALEAAGELAFGWLKML